LPSLQLLKKLALAFVNLFKLVHIVLTPSDVTASLHALLRAFVGDALGGYEETQERMEDEAMAAAERQRAGKQ
jgi:hypothetical protein